jgi:hypothetical protein
MIIGTVETLESFLDGFWKDHRAEVDQEEFERVRNLASIYSRLVITSFISSSIASFLEHRTLYSISRELSVLSRKIPFSSVQRTETGQATGQATEGYPFWVPSSPESFSRFYQSLYSYYSRFQDYLEVLEQETSSGRLSVVPRDSKRFYESLDKSLKYVSQARKKIGRSLPEDLPKVSSMVRRSTKNLRLIRDGLFDYKNLVYNLKRVGENGAREEPKDQGGGFRNPPHWYSPDIALLNFSDPSDPLEENTGN